MTILEANILGIALKDFFYSYLSQLRGMSPHTILNYRDSLKLFLQFLIQEKDICVSELTIEKIEPDQVIGFLNYLEKTRGNGAGTRNIRLAALHSFFRYLAHQYPQHLSLSQRILSIPFKRTSTQVIEYLEFEEVMALLKSIDRSKVNGRRDYALLLFMFNTGARVQEIVDLKTKDLELSKPFMVHIFGKGRKERICPIWSETAHILREYLKEQGMDFGKSLPIFLNHLGEPLTRFGIGYIFKKYLHKAAKIQPSLKKKRLHPHSMRHSTAVHLLKSGVDLATIASWLGHASVNTTNKYATMDLEMKQKALAKAKPLGDEIPPESSWKENPDILAWLESL